jgi:hypothetical protein
MVISQWYRIVEDGEPREPWNVRVVGYLYSLENEAGQEIISYQWHPAASSPVTFPHLHIGAGARVGNEQVARAHLPTERISVQAFVRLVLMDFGGRPRRDDWHQVLTETQAATADWG